MGKRLSVRAQGSGVGGCLGMRGGVLTEGCLKEGAAQGPDVNSLCHLTVGRNLKQFWGTA